jgi:crotonobetainyl-CoA:carnitine CoA-transferase CaiB-like acyl-CoA transferase
MVYHVAILSATGRPPGKAGSGTVMICPYQIFQCADGELMIAAGNDTLFAKLCRTLDAPEWAADERFLHNPERVRNRHVLIPLLEGQTAQRAVADLAAALDAAGVPHALVQDMAEVAAHPQTDAIGIKRRAGGLDFFGLPLRLDGARPDRNAPAPALGEANGWLDELLQAET